tara:strand:- start:24435 stop:25550 length:1116 start_codon:yes stop_codon:yes gene_type:complete
MQITTAKVSDLLPYANNAREHTDEQVAQVAASIQEFGWTNPIITHGQTVVAGHARLAAARKLNLEEVPVIDRSDMTEAQWKAYVLADNQLAQNATWNEGLLTLELDALQELDFDLDLIGFPDLDALMDDEPEEGLTDPDEVPEAPDEAITQPGDLWILGEHRLLCGDSTDAESVAYLMDGAKADAVVTDPPYGIGKDGQKESSGAHGGRKAYEFRGWDSERPTKESFDLILSLADKHVIWGGNYFADLLPATGKWLVWDKGQRINQSDGELAYTSEHGALRIYELNRVALMKDGAVHPTQKPVDLIEWCIEQVEAPQIIADPFLGSGTTLIAAERTRRKCYGIEIDPIYCDVIVKRWEDFTGKKAERHGGT